MDRRSRAYEWLHAHPARADALVLVLPLALCTVPSVLPSALVRPDSDGILPLALAVALAMIVPLAWRRTHPAPAALVAAMASAVYLAAGFLPSLALIAVPIFVYSLIAFGGSRAGRLGRGVALSGGILYGLRLGFVPAISGNLSASLVLAILLAGLCDAVIMIAWLLGSLARARRQRVADLEERARQLEIEQGQQAELATAAERARIAREMHDIVAHSLSVMIAQADGARYTIASVAGSGEGSAMSTPEGPLAAALAGPLEAIASTGRSALADVRGLLGVLRDDGERASRPQPTLEEARDLVETMRSSGLPTSLQILGSPTGLPAGVGLAAYRIVQESLTNTVKHGGPRASSRVVVAYEPDRVVVTVSDDGRGAAADAGDGRGGGLRGMRERVQLYGGEFAAGPAVGGGFTVRASFPYHRETS